MKFTPFSIKNQDFNKSVRGYDRDEVRAYLEKLSEEFEKLQIENERYRGDVENFREQLKDFKKIEKNLQYTLLNATESSSRAVESTKKQTALMLKETELKSAQIVEKAKEKASMIRDSVLKLREERDLLIARLNAIIDTQANILEVNLSENIDTAPHPVKKIPEKPAEIDVDDIVEKLL